MREAKWVLHTAVDDMGSGLIDFIPMVSKAWRVFYNAQISVCIISDKAEADAYYIDKYGPYIDHLHIVEPQAGYPRAARRLIMVWF